MGRLPSHRPPSGVPSCRRWHRVRRRAPPPPVEGLKGDRHTGTIPPRSGRPNGGHRNATAPSKCCLTNERYATRRSHTRVELTEAVTAERRSALSVSERSSLSRVRSGGSDTEVVSQFEMPATAGTLAPAVQLV